MKPAISKMLDTVAKELRADFVHYCENLGQAYENNIDWWVTDVATRNTIASSLFSNCCRLVLVDRLLNEGHKFNTILVDSRSLKRDIEQYLQEHNRAIKVVCQDNKPAGIKDVLKQSNFIRLLYAIWNTFKPLWTARITEEARRDFPIEPLILLDNFIFNNSFINGVFVDRYYPGIEKYLDDIDLKNIYYLPTYYQINNFRRLFKEIRNSNSNFIIKEDFLKLWDYFFAFGFYWRAAKLIKNPEPFKGFNINSMIREQINTNRCASSSFDALLKYRFAYRLKKEGIKVSLLVNWFENQVIDHGLNAGFRRWYPDTLVRGYQCWPLSPYYLSLFSTEQEYRNRVIPKEIAVMGPGYIDDARQFCSSTKVCTAPALRFIHLWQKKLSLKDNESGKKAIFIALPYTINETRTIFDYLEIVLEQIPENEWDILIKPHPATSWQSITALWKGKWPERLVFVEGDTGNILNKANLVISMGSSVCLETLARGIPLIVIANPYGITQLYLPPSIPQDMWQLCYTPQEVLDFINQIATLDECTLNVFKQNGEYIKEQFFSRVTQKEVRKFLNIERE